MPMLLGESVVRSLGRDLELVDTSLWRSLGRGLPPQDGSALGGVQNARNRPTTHKGRCPSWKPPEAVYAAFGEPQARQETADKEQKGLHSAFP